MRWIAATAEPVDSCTERICAEISSVALAVCTASDFTSEATTEKPRPASPARAASMVALSASRLVCPAMFRISSTTSPIFCAASASPVICALVDSASFAAMRTTPVVWSSWREISPIELESSSVAVAAVVTLVEASFDACSALVARCEVWSEAASSLVAVDFIVAALSPTDLRTFSTRSRKFRIAASIVPRLLSSSTIASRCCCSLRCSVTSSWVATQPPVSHWGIDDVDDASVARLDGPGERFSLRHAVENVPAIFLDISLKVAGLFAMFDQISQRAAYFHDLRLEIVHREVRLVAHHDAARRIEHAQALRHVVERRHAVAADAPQPQRDDEHGEEDRTGRRIHERVRGEKLCHGCPRGCAGSYAEPSFLYG